jgi:hypothetical protein
MEFCKCFTRGAKVKKRMLETASNFTNFENRKYKAAFHVFFLLTAYLCRLLCNYQAKLFEKKRNKNTN